MITKIFLIILITFFSFNNVSADYIKNINDDMIIYKIDEKIKDYIDKSISPEFNKNRLKNKIKKILWKTKQEILTEYLWQNIEYNNFKEYALVKIYKYLDFWDLFSNVNNNPEYAKVLENDFLKIFVTDDNFKLDNKWLYKINKYWKWKNFIEFFKINTEEKTEDFINKNFIEKEYSQNCKVQINPENYINFSKNITYSIKPNKEYENHNYENGECWNYALFYSINYFERISPNTLIYISAWQDYQWIDFSSIEVK